MKSYSSTIVRSDALGAAIAADPGSFTTLTGERPTGPLHLGHLLGTIQERVRLQDLGVDTLVVLADYQVITDREAIGHVRHHVYEAALDNVAAGIDPNKSTIFTHSAVPALNQLILPFLSLVTEPELHRNPTVKSELAASGRPLSGLLLTYPVHQAADILFCKANVVPVGKDQTPHIEMARVIARRFRDRYGAVFEEPQALLTSTPAVPGLDGRKMSKSFGNAITLSMTPDETVAVVRRTPTDSDRYISYDPAARPGVSALLTIAGLCTGRDPVEIAADIGGGGAGSLKSYVAESVNSLLAAHRHRRAEIAAEPEYVRSVVRRGNERANEIAEQTLNEVRAAMGTEY